MGDVWAYVLGGLVLAAAAFAIWQTLERQRLAREAGRLMAEREEARRQAVETKSEHAEATRAIERLRDAIGERDRDVVRLEAAVREAHKLYDAERASLQREHAEKERLLKERLEALDAHSREAFESAASRTLRVASSEFLKRAEQTFKAQHEKSLAESQQRREAMDGLVKPISDTLEKTQARLAELDASGRRLGEETARLVRALQKPEVRGRYGEIQLRRVAELAGMSALCDFDEQSTEQRRDGSLLRPDMIVRLPNERVVAVDAKCNLDAYLQAYRAEREEDRDAAMDRFAGHVADQVRKLSARGYWDAIDGSVDFVVMFVPGDHFLDAALERRPELLERAARHNVILASPATLIGLLRAVAVGWQEHKIAEDGRQLLKLGQELHDRAGKVFEHIGSVGKSLGQAVDSYNSLVGSVERNLTTTLRRFEEVGIKSRRELVDPPEIETKVRARKLTDTELFENKADRTK